ncbi:hypothetical protein N9H80_01740, partial [Candidatus Pseudothioglobus singularis]|nr:hypothetical protein [Candidatus Pseudothioglobus singularis]
MFNQPPIDKEFIIRTNYKGGYEKLLVTIALRLGIEVKYPDDIVINFKGRWVEHNAGLKDGVGPGRNDSYNYVGSISVNGTAYTDNEVKVCIKRDKPDNLLTLWPMYEDHRKEITDHTKTKPFIQEYLSGKLNLTIADLARFYSPLFTKNPNRTPLDMTFEVLKIKDSLHEDEKAKLMADYAEQTRINEERSRKEKEDQEIEFNKNMDLVTRQNEERAKKQQQDQEKKIKKLLKEKEINQPKLYIDWTNSEITSAVFNYYDDSNQHLNLYINNKKTPIKLDKKIWKLQYAAALKVSKTLEKGDIFEYITQGANKFSSKHFFNQLIADNYSYKGEKPEQFLDSIEDETTEVEKLEGVKYALTKQTVSDLNNTKFTFNTSFNV